MAKSRATKSRAGAKRGREVPRPFAFHWGGGQVVEEASYVGEHTEPAIQLLEYEGHPGSYGIRFCYFNLDGEDSFEGLRAALKETPKLRAMLQRLVS